MAYYALWATADILILSGAGDLPWAIRTIANALYYGGLLPWIYFSFHFKAQVQAPAARK
jgi:hypothetical protein